MANNRFLAATAAITAAAALLTASCSRTGPVQPYAEDATVACAGKQDLTASGSTAQTAAIAHFTKAYQDACPGRTLTYTANGSGAGIQEFLSKKTDFGSSDSPLQGKEYDAAKQRCGGADALNIPIVFGPIAITYNLPDVDVLILDGPTLAGIFSGAITRWDDPAIEALNLPAGRAHPNPRTSMPAEEIRVVHRSDESGTTDNFQQYLQTASAGSWTRGAGKTFKGGVGQGAPGNQGTAEAVKTTPGAITYNEWSSAINQGLSTADIKTPAGITHIGTDWTGTSIAPVTITGQGNNLVLDMTPAFQPSAKFGYPILLAGYAIVCSRYPDPTTGEAVKAFLQAAVTVGQTDLNKVGYIPLPAEFQSKIATAVNSIT
ncbi:phosphate ABC transporter substrate-binding protein PstS [Mycolicibacterium fallax]|uniref:Phosphate-binding protein n=1 Tax=Mycolicibacterium fallax TaxID=1793 RepID=A0A1X1RFU1_MYCFA|nr:phosphate ABC transporter substrate-binding protein PstS [Mycolicibacterium fallax]ORV04563.1 phosphate-binding protein [Mycolicibacterium fallax]BBY99701.1 phosphate-binding protein PstS [Mycolicibacterium fallax]